MPTMETTAFPEASTATMPGGVDRCAGCGATSGNLLACDDIDGKGVADISRRGKFCPNCMIGKNVRVFWPVDNSWYIGTVEQFDSSSGEHLLRYEDNDTEWVKIGESNTTAPSMGPGGMVPGASQMTDPVQSSSPPGMHPDKGQQSGYTAEQQPSSQTVTPDQKPWENGPKRHPSHGSAYGGAYPPPPPHAMSYHPHHPYSGYHPGGHPGAYGYAPPMIGIPGHPSMPPGKAELEGPHGGKKKNGPKAWSKEEDSLLLSIVQGMRMPMKWSIVAQALPERTGKQCRERYVNHLNPRLKVADWSPLEDSTIFHLYDTIGSHWAKMSKIIPGRTDNGIKNRFHNLRRQLEREDEHRLRLQCDFPDEVRLDRERELPAELKGKTADLWDLKCGLRVLAAHSVLGGNVSRNSGRFGPFRDAKEGDICVRCGCILPSVHTGLEICTKTGWCQSCTRIPPHVSGNTLRECLNLRRSQDLNVRKIVESWTDPGGDEESKATDIDDSQEEDPAIKEETVST